MTAFDAIDNLLTNAPKVDDVLQSPVGKRWKRVSACNLMEVVVNVELL